MGQPRGRPQDAAYRCGLVVRRQVRMNRTHAGPIVMRKGLRVSLAECDRLSKTAKTTTVATTISTVSAVTVTRR